MNRTPAIDRLCAWVRAHPGCRQARCPVSSSTVLRAVRAGRVVRSGRKGRYVLHVPVEARVERMGAYRPSRSEYLRGGRVEALQALLAGRRVTRWLPAEVRS